MSTKRCDGCKAPILRSRPGETALLGRLIVKSDGASKLVCSRCGKPTALSDELTKALRGALLIKTDGVTS